MCSCTLRMPETCLVLCLLGYQQRQPIPLEEEEKDVKIERNDCHQSGPCKEKLKGLQNVPKII